MRSYRAIYLKRVFLLLLLGAGFSLKSQINPSFISLSVGRGEVLRHSSDDQTTIPDLGRISLYSIYADVGIDAASTFSWASAFDNPKVGLTLLGSSYSSSSIDYVGGVLVFLSNKYDLFRSPLFFYYHVGWGITYTNNIYDLESNRTNESVSTYLNATTDARIGLGLRLSESWRFQAGGSLLHSSNMGLKKPNYGINQYNLMAGLSYEFGSESSVIEAKEQKFPRQEVLVIGHIATRQVAYNDAYLLVGNLNVEYNRVLNRVLRAGVGMALMEDGIAYEHKKYLKPLEGQDYKPLGPAETLSFGTHLNLELCFNRLSLVGQLGYYWLHPYRDIRASSALPEAYADYMKYHNEHYIYNRIGYRYRFNSGLVISLIGKTQLFKIQFTEFGIGYSF
ncbi:MAG: acyloxyacyl hydrolase [Owenweeksia sp.]